MKFDTITNKVDRISKEYEMKCNYLKENIKTVKLKLSLSEMEYKEFVGVTKRGSQLFENDK